MSDWRRDTRLPVAEHAQAKGGHRAGICRALEVVALDAADRTIKVEAEVGARIERIALDGASGSSRLR
jgi:hypothetical protein